MKPKRAIYTGFSAGLTSNAKITGKTWVISTSGKKLAITVAATKKNFRKAVTRNKIKRRIINSLLSQKTQLFTTRINVKQDRYSLLKIYPNPQITEQSFATLTADLLRCIDEIKSNNILQQ